TAFQPEGPYRLGGHCLGGLIAFEMAQQMRRRGQEVACVVMIVPPSLVRYVPPFLVSPFQFAMPGPFTSRRQPLDPRGLSGEALGMALLNYHAEVAADYFVQHYAGRLVLI